MKVVAPARTSVRTSVPSSASLNQRLSMRFPMGRSLRATSCNERSRFDSGRREDVGDGPFHVRRQWVLGVELQVGKGDGGARRLLPEKSLPVVERPPIARLPPRTEPLPQQLLPAK